MGAAERTTEKTTPKQGPSCLNPRRLRLSHVRSVFRLLSEVRDLGASPLAWRRYMLAGLLRLVGGSTGVAAEALIPRKAGNPRLLGTVVAGVGDPRLVSVYGALVERGGYAIDLRQDGVAGRTNATVTRTRQQMATDRAWRQRPDLDPWRALDCEHFILSNEYLPARRCVHLIILTRSGRESPFDELDRRVAALFHRELGRLWRRTDEDASTGLPARLEQTLELLLEGLSEGEIVRRLHLSPHTVHDHVKRLYGRFQVNSRAQLLVRLSHSPLIRAPRLCVSGLTSDDDRRFDAVDTAEPDPGHDRRASQSVNAVPRTVQA